MNLTRDLALTRPTTHYQVDLTGGPDQVYLSGLPHSEALAKGRRATQQTN
jgi:hypothetical protein